MKIKLSDHFTYGRLFRFVIPSTVMMIFTSIYGAVSYCTCGNDKFACGKQKEVRILI